MYTFFDIKKLQKLHHPCYSPLNPALKKVTKKLQPLLRKSYKTTKISSNYRQKSPKKAQKTYYNIITPVFDTVQREYVIIFLPLLKNYENSQYPLRCRFAANKNTSLYALGVWGRDSV